MAGEPRILLAGLAFPEGPRWHDDRLWFSDMHAHRVMTVDLDGHSETIVDVEHCPSGLGWLPDGRLLVVSMTDRRLLRLDPDGLQEVADLSGLASHDCNDMVVDAHGRAYIGNFGFDLHARAEAKNAEIVLVTPDGDARVVAEDLHFPNGTVITPDGRTLIVGESFGACLTAFDIAEDGSLSGRRVFAKLDGLLADGICLDAEGAVWVASPVSHAAVRVAEGGAEKDRVAVETQAYACMLGGPDGRTLFLCTSGAMGPEDCRAQRSGRIEAVTVEVPRAGLP